MAQAGLRKPTATTLILTFPKALHFWSIYMSFAQLKQLSNVKVLKEINAKVCTITMQFFVIILNCNIRADEQ